MSLHETPLTRAYWEDVGGTLYEEFEAVSQIQGVQSWRRIDGVIVLGGEKRVRSLGRGQGTPSLDGKDVVVVQTKATRLNAYIFGQALLSAELILLRWRPRSIRSVLICTADDPVLRPTIAAAHPDLELRIVEGRVGSMSLPRLPGAVEEVVRAAPGIWRSPGLLTDRLKIEALQVAGDGARSDPDSFDGQDVTTVQTYRDSLGMWLAGEVILAQDVIRADGARSVRSVVCCGRGDRAVAQVMKKYATVEVVSRR